MMWPGQAVVTFVLMAALPPLIALFRLNAARFAACLLISVLASVLAAYTYLVPIAMVLLIYAFGIALRRSDQEGKQSASRPVFWKNVALLCLLCLIAVAGFAVDLSLKYNWAPPKVLAQSLNSPLWDRDQAMTEELNQQFPVGTDEATLTSVLLKQGFRNEPSPHPSCRQPETRWMAYARCPEGTREMRYDYDDFSLICGTNHISINWSVDLNGKITRLAATRYSACL
jgi:hypothetical protein